MDRSVWKPHAHQSCVVIIASFSKRGKGEVIELSIDAALPRRPSWRQLEKLSNAVAQLQPALRLQIHHDAQFLIAPQKVLALPHGAPRALHKDCRSPLLHTVHEDRHPEPLDVRALAVLRRTKQHTAPRVGSEGFVGPHPAPSARRAGSVHRNHPRTVAEPTLRRLPGRGRRKAVLNRPTPHHNLPDPLFRSQRVNELTTFNY